MLIRNEDIICGDEFKYTKKGCMLANSGHFNVKINMHDLEVIPTEVKEVHGSIEEFSSKEGRKFFIGGGIVR